MIAYKDFIPGQLEPGGILKPAVYEPVSGLVQAANTWIKEAGIRPINVETLVIPNLDSTGSGAPVTHTTSSFTVDWMQVVRVWFEAPL